MEDVVYADDAGVFASGYGFLGFSGGDDGAIQACGIVGVCGPGEADGGCFGGILDVVEEEDGFI